MVVYPNIGELGIQHESFGKLCSVNVSQWSIRVCKVLYLKLLSATKYKNVSSGNVAGYYCGNTVVTEVTLCRSFSMQINTGNSFGSI